MIKNCKFCLIFLISVLFIFNQARGQGNLVGGVSIAEDTIAPHPSAMLDVRSINKGILIPRMTMAQKSAIANPAEGLTVYITDANDNKGLWYYSQGWKQLTEKAPYYPIGSVIMFGERITNSGNGFNDPQGVPLFSSCGMGLVNTKMEGWHLCNGCTFHALAIDLSGRFIAGWAKESETNPEYTQLGPVGEEGRFDKPHDKLVMAVDQMPSHSHAISPMVKNGIEESVGHTHKLVPGSDNHQHEVYRLNGNVGRAGFKYRRKRKCKEEEDIPLDAASANIKVNPQPMPNGGASLNFSIEYNRSRDASPDPIDNRPEYYTLVFIIKTGTQSQ